MSTLSIRVVDSEFRPIQNAKVSALAANKRDLRLNHQNDQWVFQCSPGDRIHIHVAADGFETENHLVVVRDEMTQSVIGLRKPGQISYNYGNDRLAFVPKPDELLLQVEGDEAENSFSQAAKKLQMKWSHVSEKAKGDNKNLFMHLKGNPENFAELVQDLRSKKLRTEISRVIIHGERSPVGLRNELVVRFKDQVTREEAERIAKSVGLTITRELNHAGNAFLLTRKGEPSYELLNAADKIMDSGKVIYVEPNIVFHLEPDQYTPNDMLWAQVQHLQLIEVDEAWDALDNVAVNLRGGSPDITIAVVDPNGVAPNHAELTANLTDGTSKMVISMNFATNPIAAQTAAALGGDHGTQCAGSATAAFDDNRGIPGVAPNCHLIGARIGNASNAVAMADLYMWVAGFMNGSTTAGFPATLPARPADVISSSFGVTGLALSNTIRDCFDFLTTYGRNGKGCLVCFSLGNSGYVNFTDPVGGAFRAWPTYEKTIAVGSSINTNPTNPIPVSIFADPNGNTNNINVAVDTRTLYSPFGNTAMRKPDLVAPSHTAYDGTGNLVDPVLSAVRVGTGNVDGCPGAPVCNDYRTSFGGTSHSTPTVAGAIALILSARPNLNWIQVRDILRRSCERIDAAQANAIGQWQDLDGDGMIDYSRWYGAGRLDVFAAVNLALDASLALADIYVRENLADAGLVPSTGSWWESPDIWVRQDATTPIPSLAWTSAAPHQNGRRGQDNAVFCRVRNTGSAPATSVYVRAMITHWPGLEFVYPDDFQPSNNVGAPVPNPLTPGTYLIGQSRIDNLAVGDNQIVKFNWPQAMIPPETVVISGATVQWHPCLLVEASPHDGPVPVSGLAVPVQGNNNIAQRNIAIVNAGDASADLFIGMVAGTRDKVGVATLLLDARGLRGEASIRMYAADPRVLKQLIKGLRETVSQQAEIAESSRYDRHEDAIVVEDWTRLRFENSTGHTMIKAAPGSKIMSESNDRSQASFGMTRHQELDVIEIKNLRNQIEIPIRMNAGEFQPIMIHIKGGTGDLRITQRRGDGELSAGYGIRIISDNE